MRVVLAGDSTMASRTGYGDALCARFEPGVACLNLARGGRSTKSFRADGSWARVTDLLRDREANRATYVLLQFGHNDQPGKAERATDLATEFPANLGRYLDEVAGAGATAVLVTPLTRRTFRDGALVNDLLPWAEATRRLARARQVPLLELNAESARVVEAMGPVEADTLAMAPSPARDFDRTHVGAKGAALFAGLVAEELARAVPALAAHLAPVAPAAANRESTATRPQLGVAQAQAYAYREVLRYAGVAGREAADPWDPLSDPLATGIAPKPDLVVDPASRTGDPWVFPTIQSAIDAALARGRAGSEARVHILVRPGTYRELLYVPADAPPLTLHGGRADASATRIVALLDAGMPGSRYAEAFGAAFTQAHPDVRAMHDSVKAQGRIGTAGSAVAWIRADGFQAKDLTVENAYNKAGGDADEGPARAVHSQAVAVLVDGADRVQFENVRFLGFQDTLYLRSPAPGRTVRAFLHRAYVEGDMDFIFGDATAYFLRSEIRSLGDRRISYVAAPSTHYLTRYGFVFDRCRFTHDGTPNALAGAFKLARQWFRGQRCTPYGTREAMPGHACRFGDTDAPAEPEGTISRAPLEAVGKMAVLASRIGAHIDKARPWHEWNATGTRQHRPVQYDSDAFWDNLVAAGIDPARSLGHAARKTPAEPFLAEHGNTDD